MFFSDIQRLSLSPNQQAFPFVNELMVRSEVLRVRVHKIDNATVIDCGVEVQGGWEAGVLFATVCLGGLAQVKIHWSDHNGFCWPTAEVITNHPVRACIASQYAGWPIKNGKSTVMGSGPGRAIIHKGSLYDVIDFEDSSATAILCLESELLPTIEVVRYLTKELGCDPKNLYILVAPTASLAGVVQIAARALETGLSKLMTLGYDLEKIDSGWGTCPIPPVANNSHKALGRSNDGILYGSTVLYNIKDQDEVLKELVMKIPFCSCPVYEKSFIELFEECGSFYKIDSSFFSPAEVRLCSLNTGHSFCAGAKRLDILRNSFGVK